MEICVMYYPHFTDKSNSDSEVKTLIQGYKPQTMKIGSQLGLTPEPELSKILCVFYPNT